VANQRGLQLTAGFAGQHGLAQLSQHPNQQALGSAIDGDHHAVVVAHASLRGVAVAVNQSVAKSQLGRRRVAAFFGATPGRGGDIAQHVAEATLP